MAGWLPSRPSFVRVFAARDLAVHRDPKRENFLLDPELPTAIIDLDTVGFGDYLLDLGEMCRSMAAGAPPGAEPGPGPMFDAAVAGALLEAYRQAGPPLPPSDWALLPAVVRAIAVNLARRYLTDALAEVYFQWDREHYPSLNLQNLTRGQRCLDLAEELLDREVELAKL
jgi:Ser/Thr protein kinase RdoA (MazF antagonist)